MDNPKFTLDPQFLIDEILELRHLFASKLVKDVNGKYVVDEANCTTPEHIIEQIIFSSALTIHLLKDDLRLVRNYNKIENSLLDEIGRAFMDDDSLLDIYPAQSSMHNFIRLRYFQYKILIEELYSGNNTSNEISNYLYFNPLKSGLSTNTLLTINSDFYNLIVILIHTSIEQFSIEFSERVKLTNEEIKEMLASW